MDIVEALDRLKALGVGLEAVAEQFNVSYRTVQAWRLDPGSQGYRRPPDGWLVQLAALAYERGEALMALSQTFAEAEPAQRKRRSA